MGNGNQVELVFNVFVLFEGVDMVCKFLLEVCLKVV